MWEAHGACGNVVLTVACRSPNSFVCGNTHDVRCDVPGACVLWHYFEVGEGKNESDSLGSIIKLAFKRAVLRETDRAISSPEDVAAMIRSCLQETTSKYDFIRIIVAPQIDRDPKPKGIPHRGIQSRHSFVRSADGIIYARDLSCPQCISTGQVCEECRTSCKIAYRPAHVNISVDEDDEDVDVDEELDQLYDNAVDISLSEGEETDQESSDEDEEDVGRNKELSDRSGVEVESLAKWKVWTNSL